MYNKVDETLARIDRGFEQYPKSVVLWSGGKDSMVLLHLLRRLLIDVPVIFFREPWQPHKYAFQDHMIREWDLLAYTWHPTQSAMQQKDDEFEVQNWYQLNNSTLTCPSGITPPVENLPWACAIDMLKRPKQTGLLIEDVDAAWVGHKRCDSDPILGGDAGTRVEARVMPDRMSLLYPIRDWSHDEVWQYIEDHRVPFDEARYVKIEGKWQERKHMRYNADYVHACTACLDRRETASKVVYCPKLDMEIESNAEKVPWVEPELLEYMRD